LTSYGWIGVWLLVIAAAVILLELALAAMWSYAVAQRAQDLSARVETERGAIQADLARLRRALDETRELWRPYARVLRWFRHPLVIALLESYRARASAR
jgi:hypothetical protein